MNMMMRRSHGWQRPIHPLQIVGMAIFSFLVVAFYTFFGLFLGNTIAEITVTSIFSFLALSVVFLFIRCTAIDPTDRTSSRKKKKKKTKNNRSSSNLNYGYIFSQLVLRLFRKVEKKILRTFIRRNYLDPWMSSGGASMDPPLLPFPLVSMNKDDVVSPDPDLMEEEDLSYCSLCDLEVKKNSKHCRTCNRCVEGFDHHCRWLNNCVGKRNYTTFILLMVSVLLMLILEGGTAIAIFVRCFTNKRGIEQELERKLFVEFPRWLLATISMLLILMTAYGSAALGQLFFFHVVLIRKGIRTYDYILAMKESHSMDLDPFDDEEDSGFSSDESSDFNSPEKPSFVSRFICQGRGLNQNAPTRLSIRIDGDSEGESATALAKKSSFRVSIDPWKLIKLSREKALLAAEKAREKLARNTQEELKHEPLKPLPLEKKCGPLMTNAEAEKNVIHTNSGSTPLISKVGLSVSPGGRFISSPRRRFSGSPTMFSSAVAPSPKSKYRSSFDLKLTEVSKELETYISKQVLCSVIKRDATEASPR